MGAQSYPRLGPHRHRKGGWGGVHWSPPWGQREWPQGAKPEKGGKSKNPIMGAQQEIGKSAGRARDRRQKFPSIKEVGKILKGVELRGET